MESMNQSNSQTTPESAILAELMAAAPVAAADLKARVQSKVAGLKDKHYKSVLDGLVAARKIHARPKLGSAGKPTKTIASYGLGAPPPPPPTPRELAPAAILEALRQGAMSPKALAAEVAASVPGLTLKDLKPALAELVAARKIHGQPKRGKSGKATKTIEAYVLGGPEPGEFLAPVLALWREKQAEALAAGIGEEHLLTALLAALNKDISAVVLPRADDANDRDLVLRVVRHLVDREGAGALVPLRKVRAELRLSKERFDAAVLQLYAQDALILHHHDYVGSLSSAERDGLVIDEHGNHYVGVALRGGN